MSQEKLQMKGLYKDSTSKYAIGYFYHFYANGKLQSVGRYEDNKRQGLWLSYHSNGYIKDSTVYDYGEARGIALRWHNNGFMSDSISYNADGTAVSVSWFDDGSLSSAGRLNYVNQPNGKWQFFHQNGKLSSLETYDNGKLVEKNYFDEKGDLMSDNTDKSHGAEFIGGIPKWMDYLKSKLYFPPGYKIVNGDKALMVVEFTIDEKGNVKDVDIPVPFHDVLNNVVVGILKKSAKWNPAMNHNRKVSYMHKQAITFNAPEER
jgi:hypothetical protein